MEETISPGEIRELGDLETIRPPSSPAVEAAPVSAKVDDTPAIQLVQVNPNLLLEELEQQITGAKEGRGHAQ